MAIETFLSLAKAAGHGPLPIPQRSAPLSGITPGSDFYEMFTGGNSTASGESVTERTALNLAAVYGSVRLLAEVEASLPCHVYRYRASGIGKDKATDSYLYPLIHDAPNNEMSAFLYRLYMRQNRALWGNGYALPFWNAAGRLDSLWPLRPDLMQVYRNPNGTKVYDYDNGDAGSMMGGRKVSGRYLSADLIHVRGIGDDLVGYSPIRLHREGLGLAKAAEKFGASFFRNAARMSGILEFAGKVRDIPESMAVFNEKYAGAMNAGKILGIDQGSKFVSTTIPPEDAQYLQTRAFQRTEVYMMYGVLPHMMGDTEKSTSWGTGIEQQTIGFYTFTLAPSLEMTEQEMNLRLLNSGLFIEHNVDGLLRGDAKTRAEVNHVKRNDGVINADEWRALENQNPIGGYEGSVYLVQGAMIPVSSAGQQQSNNNPQK